MIENFKISLKEIDKINLINEDDKKYRIKIEAEGILANAKINLHTLGPTIFSALVLKAAPPL